MRRSGERRPHICQPFARNRIIHERRPQKRLRDRGVGVEDFANGIARHQRDAGLRQGQNAVIHHVEHEKMRVAKIAWNEKRDDLTATALDDFIPAGETFDHHVHVGGDIALADQIRLRGDDLRVRDRRQQRVSVARRKTIAHIQSAKQRVLRRFDNGCALRWGEGSSIHETLQCVRRP